MRRNRSMPEDVLIPVLSYPSLPEAVDWLVRAFGFRVRWTVGEHRAQLAVGPTAAFAITQGEVPQGSGDHLMVRVEDVTVHREQARAAGAQVSEVGTFPYGESQYTATDPFGRTWVFTQSIQDVTPTDWGAQVGPPAP